MTLHVHREQDRAVDMSYSCDHDGCDASPTDEQIIAGGGLLKMGWKMRFDLETRKHKHYCPDHASDVEENS
jgi:hypothetical protein